MQLSSITFLTLYLTSHCLVFELQEHISDALRLCRGYGHGSGGFLDGRKDVEIGRHPAKWLVHSFLEDKHYSGAGRLLQGTSFQTSSQQSSGTSFQYSALRHNDQSSLSGFLSLLCSGGTTSGRYKRAPLSTLGTRDENGFVSILTLLDSCLVVLEVRSEERKILEKAGLVQGLTIGVAPIIVVIASVCTFTLHMALGNDLTAAQVCMLSESIYSIFSIHKQQPTSSPSLLVNGSLCASLCVYRPSLLWLSSTQ